MKSNPLIQLEALGQSIWLDYIKRDLFFDDKLKKLIVEDSLRGMTSNPSIFEKAIAESDDYDEDIQKMTRAGKNALEIYEALTQKDVQDAADEFRHLFDTTKGLDGYVSLEVNPHLAHDTDGTIAEAVRLWRALNRPNVFIKVPATKEGLPAIQQLIRDGINVNVTLLFGLARYRQVAEAYLAGIKARIADGNSVKNIASVASFFLSRIDVMIDPMLKAQNKANAEMGDFAKQLQGQMAIASANMAYEIYHELFTGENFKILADKGAHVQRLLWASTSTKNPEYSDIKYVEALIGPETVNTLPLETIVAYRDHGKPEVRLNSDLTKTKWYFNTLSELGINIDQVTQQLESEGVDKFSQSFDQLIETLKKKMEKSQIKEKS
jgi:transaldolase